MFKFGIDWRYVGLGLFLGILLPTYDYLSEGRIELVKSSIMLGLFICISLIVGIAARKARE